MNSTYRHFHRLAWIAVLLAFGIVVFGAFVRLSNAGLSCPDWPTCYGQVTWPVHEHEITEANRTFERIVEPHKAWREQIHRHAAALLGLLVLTLAVLAARRRPWGVASIMSASGLVALSIPAYTGISLSVPWELNFTPNYFLSAVLVALGQLILLVQALRWSDTDASRSSALVLMIVVFQAMLGMWTVVWLLKPAIVTAHLLGGLTTFSLLTWLAWRTTPDAVLIQGIAPKLRRLLWIGLVLLSLQIALGGWTSSNYAALACGSDFPTCLGEWWPSHDFHQGFVLWRGIGADYEGGVLDGSARVAVQLAHRLGAILVFGHFLVLAIRMLRTPGLVFWGSVLALLLFTQVGLGIANVVLGLPLWVATAHTAGAALLLFVVVGLLARLRRPE